MRPSGLPAPRHSCWYGSLVTNSKSDGTQRCDRDGVLCGGELMSPPAGPRSWKDSERRHADAAAAAGQGVDAAHTYYGGLANQSVPLDVSSQSAHEHRIRESGICRGRHLPSIHPSLLAVSSCSMAHRTRQLDVYLDQPRQSRWPFREQASQQAAGGLLYLPSQPAQSRPPWCVGCRWIEVRYLHRRKPGPPANKTSPPLCPSSIPSSSARPLHLI